VSAQGGSLLARVRRLLGRVPPGRVFSGGSIAAIGCWLPWRSPSASGRSMDWARPMRRVLAKEPDQVKKKESSSKCRAATRWTWPSRRTARFWPGRVRADHRVVGRRLGKKLHTLKGQSNMWPPVFMVAFSPDGKTLASATESMEADKVANEVKLWDVATGKERVPLKGHRSNVYSLAFRPTARPWPHSTSTPAP